MNTQDSPQPGADSTSGDAKDFEDEGDIRANPAPDGETLIVDVDGFEGPLDLLLTLAKTQKVDLTKISILDLVEQYLAFVAHAKKLRLELAADYLVMAAWLTYLKSRLLLPEPEEEEGPSGEELAARLQFQLQRLEAMRKVAAQLMARDRLGRDIFPRGDPEPVRIKRQHFYKDTLTDLLKAYTRQRTKDVKIDYTPHKPPEVVQIEEARRRVEAMLGAIDDWSSLAKFLPDLGMLPGMPDHRLRSHMASMFVACLELTRDGVLDVRQLKMFGPIYVRRKSEDQPVDLVVQPADAP